MFNFSLSHLNSFYHVENSLNLIIISDSEKGIISFPNVIHLKSIF